MKIGIDIRNIGKKRTGDEVVFFNLVKNLAEIDSQNDYLLFTDTKDSGVLQYIVKNLGIEGRKNFQIISLPTINKFTWNFWTLPQYLKKNPLDVYHTQYILPFFISKKIKLITTIHDVSFMAYPEMIKKSDLFFLRTLIPWSLKRADKIIAISEFTKNEIIKYFKTPAEKIEVVYNAVGDNFYQEISEEKLKTVKEKYNLPDKFILYVGTMQPRKNLPVLIEAFASLADRQTYKLVLAGNKSGHNFDKNIDANIEKFHLRNEIIFPGFIDEADKPALYKLADIFCFPSLYEGFGIPLLEAMTQGTPVIASNIAPHREIAGQATFFFEPKNSDDLAEKIEKIIKDSILKNQLIEEGKIKILKFSWKNSAEKILAIYQETASE
jgi:glycosyltransferase involved in cell wall biosynthesis